MSIISLITESLWTSWYNPVTEEWFNGDPRSSQVSQKRRVIGIGGFVVSPSWTGGEILVRNWGMLADRWHLPSVTCWPGSPALVLSPASSSTAWAPPVCPTSPWAFSSLRLSGAGCPHQAGQVPALDFVSSSLRGRPTALTPQRDGSGLWAQSALWHAASPRVGHSGPQTVPSGPSFLPAFCSTPETSPEAGSHISFLFFCPKSPSGHLADRLVLWQSPGLAFPTLALYLSSSIFRFPGCTSQTLSATCDPPLRLPTCPEISNLHYFCIACSAKF